MLDDTLEDDSELLVLLEYEMSDGASATLSASEI
jgi:hypothetical protein